ncbi:ferritin-like domain-containing protein [Piscinibacter koreensis]|uniref:PA2169 family four-helix-bundle protein n=1 Tax=Piscinibacter koreensis TaxID=2742824 RepID=A0A7Y6NJB2_9BURK|nr:PA2169 family four-helix-bundle protein [Schlegelella koreensis]NUZ04154.1 PA2169 family four-helix-bundle protein [Schlegelella koreensis]
MSDNNTIDTLNTLIETCKDGEYGFRSCAEHCKSGDLKAIFLSRSQDCQRAARELQAIVSRLGGAPETDSSVSGTMHRGWVSVVGTLTGYSDQQMLDECERGEDAALERYRTALQQPLPSDILSVVQAQYEGVKRNHDQIRSLRNQHRAANT